MKKTSVSKVHSARGKVAAVCGRAASSQAGVRVILIVILLITSLVLMPETPFAGKAYVYAAAPGFRATAESPSQSTVYVKRGASIYIKGRFLAKGDKVSKYQSSKTSVATISSKGKLKAKKAGTTTITLRTKKGAKDTIKVVVVKKSYNAKSIKITSAKSINVKQIARLSIKTNPKKTTSTIKWTSSNKKVATVDKAGYITGKKAGTTTIKAKTNNGKVSYCRLTVRDAVKISRTSASVRMDRPAGIKLTASAPSGTIVWSSSNNSIATVKNGVVVPKKVGVVNITAKTKVSGTSAVCRVTVVPHIKAKGINVSPDSGTIYAGKTKTLAASLVSAVDGQKSNDDILWTSSNTKIAKVSSTGVVTGVGYGEAIITAKAESGPAAKAVINVKTVKASVSNIIITPGMRYKAKFTFYGSGSASGATYSSSDKSIATVTSAGNIYANKRNKETGKAKSGTVTITIKTAAGDKASMKVIVKDEPTIIDVSKWQGDINWEDTSKSVDLAILRVMHGASAATEPKYKSYADSCKAYGLPFGVYAYASFKSKASAEKEASAFYKQAVSGGRKPLFFVVDAEESYITRANTEAYIAKLRSLAKSDGISRLKVGVYVGHHLYKKLNLNLTTSKSNSKTPDFVWIPRYNLSVGGARDSSVPIPDFKCDMWQYSSSGSIPGISGAVDLNALYTPDGEELSSKSNFSFEWLIAGPDA